jgi:2-polyprenyl-3-methyl-5-hydroxy-6-metoxy-1,4-benzoquinol methylase
MAEVVSGNVYDKYRSRNPIVRLMMRGFFSHFEDLIRDLPLKSIFEVGCGEGEIGARLSILCPNASYYGVDIANDVIHEARRRYPELKFDVKSIYDLPNSRLQADLIIASEVFEHLETPDLGMEAVLNIPFKYFLLSVPREPIWHVLNVIRGKYLSEFGNTPGHLNHWSKKGFIKFLEQYNQFLTIEKVVSPFPWTMVLCKKKM